MEWQLTWANNPKHLALLEKKASRGDFVRALDERPELYPDLEIVWKAFGDLSHTRFIGMQPSGILMTEITAWLDFHEFMGDDRTEIYELVTAMDKFFLRFSQEKSSKESKSG